ncbi:MAG: prephenate dehydrogenase [Prolixibacteraceae bacterium]|nr:prephenate dehydrogenase [Prolixibacteraceae bacterium]
MKITIIGLGLIGGSLAIDLKKQKFVSSITGVDIDKKNAGEALKLGLVDKIEELEPAVSGSDLVIIAIPVDKIKILIPKVLDLIPDSATVTDMGSAKSEIISVVKNHPRRKNYVPAHPMAGTEDSGPQAAFEGLFKGKICIICDQEDSGPQHLALIEKIIHLTGMDIAYMTSDEQDHSTAFVSHLPHAAAYALANAVLAKEDRNIIFDLASGGFRSTVRLAKSSSSMWHPIFQQNRNYVVEALGVYIKHLTDFKESLEKKDDDKVLELITNANKIRGVLAGDNSSLVRNMETNFKLYTK